MHVFDESAENRDVSVWLADHANFAQAVDAVVVQRVGVVFVGVVQVDQVGLDFLYGVVFDRRGVHDHLVDDEQLVINEAQVRFARRLFFEDVVRGLY